jgi:nitroalkane oxidase
LCFVVADGCFGSDDVDFSCCHEHWSQFKQITKLSENQLTMIGFQLTPEQQALRSNVGAFASAHLSRARSIYEAAGASGKWSDRFRSTLPLYQEAVKAGLIKAQVPQPLGGLGGSLMDATLVVEEMYAVEASASLTILGTGLGLTPLLLAGSPEQHERFLKPFLSGEGEPLASLVFSEPAGSANYSAPGSSGLMTTAKLIGGEYVINGEKVSVLAQGCKSI